MNKRKDDLKLIPEERFGEMVTAISRVHKPGTAKPKVKPKRKKRR